MAAVEYTGKVRSNGVCDWQKSAVCSVATQFFLSIVYSMFIYIYIYYISVYACVCVCVQTGTCISLSALDKVPLLDDRRPLNLFWLDRYGGYRRLVVLVRPHVAVHVVVRTVIVFVAYARPAAVHVLVGVVGLFHHAVRVPVVVMVRLIIGTGTMVVGHVIFDARVGWPARRRLPMGPGVREQKPLVCRVHCRKSAYRINYLWRTAFGLFFSLARLFVRDALRFVSLRKLTKNY